MAERVRVGLAGAGPWAEMFTAPLLSRGPDTELAGVWARREEAAQATATKFNVPAFAGFEDLLRACDAVAVSVAPGAQPDLAIRAARAGRALLLEKPLAADLAGAERLAAAIDAAGVPSMVMLSYRFIPEVRTFLTDVAGAKPLGGRVTFIGGGLLGGPFAAGWRLERGALLDLGPHVFDLAQAAMGAVTRIQAHGDPLQWVGLLLDHETGARSQLSISGMAGIERPRVEVEVYTRDGASTIDALAAFGPQTLATIQQEFAECVRAWRPHPLDGGHALRLQRLLNEAERQLRRA